LLDGFDVVGGKRLLQSLKVWSANSPLFSWQAVHPMQKEGKARRGEIHDRKRKKQKKEQEQTGGEKRDRIAREWLAKI